MMGWHVIDSSGPEYGSAEGSCEHGNEAFGIIKCWEILEYLSNWRLFRKDLAPYSYVVTVQFNIILFFTP
jgi:hypothetical protein